jgi:hypothetical protein
MCWTKTCNCSPGGWFCLIHICFWLDEVESLCFSEVCRNLASQTKLDVQNVVECVSQTKQSLVSVYQINSTFCRLNILLLCSLTRNSRLNTSAIFFIWSTFLFLYLGFNDRNLNIKHTAPARWPIGKCQCFSVFFGKKRKKKLLQYKGINIFNNTLNVFWFFDVYTLPLYFLSHLLCTV